MANRQRQIQLKFRVTPEERELIEQKMAQIGTNNMAAYLRKMAIDGYVVNLELPELKEMVSLLRRSSNNLNQLAKRMNETGRIYEADIVVGCKLMKRFFLSREKGSLRCSNNRLFKKNVVSYI